MTLNGKVSALGIANLQIIALVPINQSLAIALPTTAGAPEPAFLLLTPRLARLAE